MSIISDIADVIDQHRRFLITSHIRLDGDAVGCEIAMLHVLKALGKQAQAVNDGEVPRSFRFLDTADDVASDPSAVRDDIDVALVLDSATLERTGKVAERIPKDCPIVNIDHHVSNDRFGALNWVEERSSTGEMLWRLFREAAHPLPPVAGDALYVAIITDTGRFTQGNTTAEAFEAAAALTRGGVNPGDMGSKLYRDEPFSVTMLRAKAVSTIERQAEGQIAAMCLTQAMFRDTETDPIDTQEFADIPRSLEGVEVGVLFREMDTAGAVKVSFRSQGKVDVNAIAQQFGGGGHVRAAGCTLSGGLDHVKEQILDEVQNALDSV